MTLEDEIAASEATIRRPAGAACEGWTKMTTLGIGATVLQTFSLVRILDHISGDVHAPLWLYLVILFASFILTFIDVSKRQEKTESSTPT